MRFEASFFAKKKMSFSWLFFFVMALSPVDHLTKYLSISLTKPRKANLAVGGLLKRRNDKYKCLDSNDYASECSKKKKDLVKGVGCVASHQGNGDGGGVGFVPFTLLAFIHC